MGAIAYRTADAHDSRAVCEVFRRSLVHLVESVGGDVRLGDDPDGFWRERRPLFEHMASSADRWAVAEREGEVVGYARSLLRGHVRQLSEFFVVPEAQRAGVGGELLARTFAAGDGAQRRVVVATLNAGAQTRYLRAGLRPLCPLYGLTLPAPAPAPAAVESDLAIAACLDVGRVLEAAAAIDSAVLGYVRGADHGYLALQRTPLLALRGGEVAGYGYVGERCGPFAALDPADLPALLAAAESEAASRGLGFSLEVPGVSHAAIDHLVARGCAVDAFFAIVLTDGPLPGLDRYVATAPPFFL